MFGGLCYYADNKPFAILLGNALALKLSAERLRDGCARKDGHVFNPGGGDFRMREYLELYDQVLMDEARIDTYVHSSHRFVSGQRTMEEGLAYDDLWRDRERLYEQIRKR
jgi:hypothetical protein